MWEVNKQLSFSVIQVGVDLNHVELKYDFFY